MIGGDDLQRARLQPGPQRILVGLVAEWRAHDTAGGMVPILVEILGVIEGQMLDQGFAIDPFALLTRPADRLVAFLATRVDHIERHPGHVGNHDRPIGGFALDLRRT